MSRPILSLGTAMVVALLVLGACGDDAGSGADDGVVTIAVTTSVLGDVVEHLVGNHATVETMMPAGADPHTFQPSARQVAVVADADALIVNGAGFEGGILDAVEAATDGVPTFEAIDAVDRLSLGDHDGHERDEDEDEHEHGDSGADPHFFNDPSRMHAAAEAISAFLSEQVPELDTDARRAEADAYLRDLEGLDREIRTILEAVPADDRLLVTDHEVFGYFADAYDFEVVGVVIPGGGTSEGVGGGSLADLVAVVENRGVSAVFTSSASADVVDTLADEAGIDVVELFGESLGPPGSEGASYLRMQRTNAERVAAVLGGERA